MGCIFFAPLYILAIMLIFLIIIPIIWILKMLVRFVFYIADNTKDSINRKNQIKQQYRFEQLRKKTIEEIYPSYLIGIYKIKKQNNSTISLFFRNDKIIDCELVDDFFYQHGLHKDKYYAIKVNIIEESVKDSNIYLFTFKQETLEYIDSQSEYNDVWNYWTKKKQQREQIIANNYPSYLIGIDEFILQDESSVLLRYKNNTTLICKIVYLFLHQIPGSDIEYYYAIKLKKDNQLFDDSGIYFFRSSLNAMEYIDSENEYIEVSKSWYSRVQRWEQAISSNYPSHLIGIDEFIIQSDSSVSLHFINDKVIDYEILEKYNYSSHSYILLKPFEVSKLQSDINVYLFKYEQDNNLYKISYIESQDEYKEVFNSWNEYHKKMDEYYNSDYYSILGYDYEYVIKDPGTYGEYLTSLYYKEVNPLHYCILNAYIPTRDEIGSTEIDSIIITEAGLYVIEVKNREGKWEIEYDEAYICYDKKIKVKNPLLQNKNHMEALTNYITHSGDAELINAFEILDKRIIGYVVFIRNDQSERSVLNTNLNKAKNRCSMHDQIGNKITEDIKYRYIQNQQERYQAMRIIFDKLSVYQNNQELKEKHDYYVKRVMNSEL